MFCFVSFLATKFISSFLSSRTLPQAMESASSPTLIFCSLNEGTAVELTVRLKKVTKHSILDWSHPPLFISVFFAVTLDLWHQKALWLIFQKYLSLIFYPKSLQKLKLIEYLHRLLWQKLMEAYEILDLSITSCTRRYQKEVWVKIFTFCFEFLCHWMQN